MLWSQIVWGSALLLPGRMTLGKVTSGVSLSQGPHHNTVSGSACLPGVVVMTNKNRSA